VQGNILITEEGIACLGGVGVTGAIADPEVELDSMATDSEPPAVRYMAPELQDPKNALSNTRRNITKECDIYSLAMVAFEVFLPILRPLVLMNISLWQGPLRCLAVWRNTRESHSL